MFIKHSNAETQASTWDIHDVYEEQLERRLDDATALAGLLSKDTFKTESSTLKSRALMQASFDHSTQSAMLLQTTAESGAIPNSSASTLQTTVDSNNSDSSFLRMDSGSVGMNASLTKNTDGAGHHHPNRDQLLKKVCLLRVGFPTVIVTSID